MSGTALDSIDHLMFEKGSKVGIIKHFHQYGGPYWSMATYLTNFLFPIYIKIRFRVEFKGSIGGKVELHGETTNRCPEPNGIIKHKMRNNFQAKKVCRVSFLISISWNMYSGFYLLIKIQHLIQY